MVSFDVGHDVPLADLYPKGIKKKDFESWDALEKNSFFLFQLRGVGSGCCLRFAAFRLAGGTAIASRCGTFDNSS